MEIDSISYFVKFPKIWYHGNIKYNAYSNNKNEVKNSTEYSKTNQYELYLS